MEDWQIEETINTLLKDIQDLKERVNNLEKRVKVGVGGFNISTGIDSIDEDIVRLKRANKDLKHQLTSHYCGSQ